MKLLAYLALLPTLALADGVFTFHNATLSDGATVQICETLTIDARGCTTISHSYNQLSLSNVSIRGRVGLGDDVVILGFIVPPGPARAVHIRGRGPSLMQHGVKDALQDPTLTVVNQAGIVIDHNDNWNEPERYESMLALGMGEYDVRESATLLVLEPGAYTAILAGKGQTGVGIVELFPR